MYKIMNYDLTKYLKNRTETSLVSVCILNDDVEDIQGSIVGDLKIMYNFANTSVEIDIDYEGYDAWNMEHPVHTINRVSNYGVENYFIEDLVTQTVEWYCEIYLDE